MPSRFPKQTKKLLLGGGLAVVVLALLVAVLWQWGGVGEPGPESEVGPAASSAPSAPTPAISYPAIEQASNPNVPDGAPVPKTRTFSSQLGYSLQYPVGWQVDDSQSKAPAEFINEPEGRAFLSVQVLNDERLRDPAKRQQVYTESEQGLRTTPGYKISALEWKQREAGGNTDSYMARGSYVEKGARWQFKELLIFVDSGYIFAFRGAVLDEYTNQYGPVLDEMMFSFKPVGK